MKTPVLTSIPSAGPKRTTYTMGAQTYVDERYTPCAICDGTISEGVEISYFRGGWVHAKCATNSLIEGDAVNAWLVLGSDLARHPRAYNTAETKVILNQVMRIAASMQPDAFEVDA